MSEVQAKFSVGQLVLHRLFEYRGVVIDVDPHFLGTEHWYADTAKSRPPKDFPWYHVLVDGSAHQTYVAERNLEPDFSDAPVDHPEVLSHFAPRMKDGVYQPRQRRN